MISQKLLAEIHVRRRGRGFEHKARSELRVSGVVNRTTPNPLKPFLNGFIGPTEQADRC
jgi:hypothetical protein